MATSVLGLGHNSLANTPEIPARWHITEKVSPEASGWYDIFCREADGYKKKCFTEKYAIVIIVCIPTAQIPVDLNHDLLRNCRIIKLNNSDKCHHANSSRSIIKGIRNNVMSRGTEKFTPSKQQKCRPSAVASRLRIQGTNSFRVGRLMGGPGSFALKSTMKK